MIGFSRANSRPVEPTTHTAQEFFDVLQARILAGHHLIPADDPRSLLKGFADQEQGDMVSIRLSDLKRTYGSNVVINIDTSGRTIQEVLNSIPRASWPVQNNAHSTTLHADVATWAHNLHGAYDDGAVFEKADDPFARIVGVTARLPDGSSSTHRIPLTKLKENWPSGAPFTSEQWHAYVRQGRADPTLLFPAKSAPKWEARVPAHYERSWAPSKAQMDEILEEAGVETGDWVDLINFRGTSSPVSDEYEVGTHGALLREYLKRTGLGHRLYSYDDHRSQSIGFIDTGTSGDERPTYVCTNARHSMIPEDVATSFQMTPTEIASLLRSKDGREQVFGKWNADAEGGDFEEVDPEILWGSSVVNSPYDEEVAVGDGNVVEPVVLTGEPGESPADRAAAVARLRAKQPQPARRVQGWTSFRWPECHAAIPVFAVVDAEGTKGPYPAVPKAPENPPGTDLKDFQFPAPCKYGVYRRVKDHLIRVWAEGGWDESVLQDDGTYLCQSWHQRVDAFITGQRGGDNIDLLAPAGFEGCLEEAEARAAEVLRGGGS